MDTIKSEKKQNSFWKWIILLVVIGIAVLLFILFGKQAEAEPAQASSLPQTSSQSEAQPDEPSDDDEPLVDMDLPVGKLLVTDGRQNYTEGLVLVVPKLDLEVEIQNGTTDETLRLGPGLYEYAQMPWEKDGNVSIAGHRDVHGSHFYSIDKLEAGDMFYLLYDGKVYRYVYKSTIIVKPDNWDPIRTQGYGCLTLTSCDPIGTTLSRIVVQAEYLGREKQTPGYAYEHYAPGFEQAGQPEQENRDQEPSNEPVSDPADEEAPVSQDTLSDSADVSQTSGSATPESAAVPAFSMQPQVQVLASTVTNVRLPKASGTVVYSEANVTVDASNSSEGYVMAKFTGTTDKRLKLRLTKDGIIYTYDFSSGGQYQSFILSEGSGTYTLQVFQQITGDNYALLMTKSLNVQLTSGLTPFLYPNAYIPYQNSSNCIAIGEKLVQNAASELEAVQAIYQYAVNNISYDFDKASNVKAGYITAPDQTVASQKGICLDYAGVMTCMLRTQGIPTKLVVGYAGDIYHAWISTYIKDIGWVDGIIYFDGQNWKLMDPTFASSGGGDQDVINFITNTANYKKVYVY